MKITIIGVNDQIPQFSDEEILKIKASRCFAGGKRHHELVKPFLPDDHRWCSIVAPLDALFEVVRKSSENWIVFASGDPLFFGIGNTLKREFSNAEIIVLPNFNSLQLLGHRFGINYGEFPVITLTGRSWKAFDKALMEGADRMSVLTDRKKTPASIATHMLEYGYVNYRMFYGEKMGGAEERILKLTMEEALKLDFRHPNCFFLEKTNDAIPAKGIPETFFERLEGRPRMITKMPVRLTTLALMQLYKRKVFWDIGACTGSISIEALLNHPHLEVTAFEIRPESESIIQRNSQKFQAPGIQFVMGDCLNANKEELCAPDAVFVGGYGGKMEEVLGDVHNRLQSGGVIGFNSVSEESKSRFLAWSSKYQYQMVAQHNIKVDDQNPIDVLIILKG
jgi:precorrin-6Y C5,15-methyltransferase (decarboxylating)